MYETPPVMLLKYQQVLTRRRLLLFLEASNKFTTHRNFIKRVHQ